MILDTNLTESMSYLFLLCKCGFMASLSGLAAYLYKVNKHPEIKFRFSSAIIMVIVAFFVGEIFSEFLPESTPNRDGVILLAGWCSKSIADLLESKSNTLFIKFI